MNALRRGHPIALGALFGALDALWTMAQGATSAGLLTAIVGTWLFTAWVIGSGWRAAWTLALGRGGLEAARGRIIAWCRAAWTEGDEQLDRRRATHLAGWLTGFLVWFISSVALLVYLIEHRHGALLIQCPVHVQTARLH